MTQVTQLTAKANRPKAGMCSWTMWSLLCFHVTGMHKLTLLVCLPSCMGTGMGYICCFSRQNIDITLESNLIVASHGLSAALSAPLIPSETITCYNLALCRYLAVFTGGKQGQYQLTVLNVGAQVPQVHCNMKLHAAQLPSEPWDAVNCMQLQLIRCDHLLQLSCCLCLDKSKLAVYALKAAASLLLSIAII